MSENKSMEDYLLVIYQTGINDQKKGNVKTPNFVLEIQNNAYLMGVFDAKEDTMYGGFGISKDTRILKAIKDFKPDMNGVFKTFSLMVQDDTNKFLDKSINDFCNKNNCTVASIQYSILNTTKINGPAEVNWEHFSYLIAGVVFKNK